MSNIKYKYILFPVLIWLISSSFVFSKIKTEIIFKIDQEIITNIDIENEIKFLIFLNPRLDNLKKVQIEQISINSLKNRKIKEIELSKFFDFTTNDLGDEFIKNFLINAKINKNQLLEKLDLIDLPYSYFENNFIIDNVWRQFIFKKFKDQVKLNIDDLRNQVKNQNTKIEELNLSEILFEINVEEDLNIIRNNIFKEIERSGFEAAASIYSISETKNYGGKLGWINSNQISKKIYNEINQGNNITEPVKTNNGYLIIKVNDRREIDQAINFDEELNKIINTETEKQLNKLGYIYFNKIKKRIFISET